MFLVCFKSFCCWNCSCVHLCHVVHIHPCCHSLISSAVFFASSSISCLISLYPLPCQQIVLFWFCTLSLYSFVSSILFPLFCFYKVKCNFFSLILQVTSCRLHSGFYSSINNNLIFILLQNYT